MDKSKEGTLSVSQAYIEGAGKVILFVGGIFLFRAVNELYDRYLASDTAKPVPPRR